MRIYRSAITSLRPLELDEDVDFSCFDFGRSYPLLGIQRAHVSGLVERVDDFLTANLRIEGTLLLSDARTCKPFEYPVSVDDVFDLLEDANEEGDGYIFPGTSIELSDLVYSILRSQVPLKPLSGDSSLPSSGEGYSVLTEEEKQNELFAEPDPRFDVLKDVKVD